MEQKEKAKKKFKTVYQMVAEKHGVTARFVGIIARGERVPKRGKGLEVKKDLDYLLLPN
jgi:hypothetical protein